MTLLETAAVAFAMFSAVPVPQPVWNEKNMRYALCAFPLVGVVCGLAWWGWAALAARLSFPLLLRAAGLCLAPVLVTGGIHLDGYAEARRAGKIIVLDSRQICRSLDADVRSLPRESAPAALENWARRRGTLAPDANEQHLGLDDTDLMLRTVQAEFNLKNLFAK